VESGLFEGEEAVLHLIERIVGPLGLRVDESSPSVDARVLGGSRFHAIIPPLSGCSFWALLMMSRLRSCRYLMA
jgi:Flp pilus assembly CpaF family ATPase